MERNIAVLIDFENIAAGTEKEGLGRFDVEAVMARVKDKGRILVARSYADWGRFARFKQSLLAANVTMFELTSHGMQDKNRADIAMVVDCLELAFTREYIDTFVVVSGDSDFTPLVLKMRELNKHVIGMGTRSSTSALLIGACDEFIFYDSIVKSKRRRAERTSRTDGELADAYDLLVAALEGLQQEDPEPPHASVVKGAMRRKSPDFSETEYGFASFGRFLEAAQAKGFVKTVKDTKSGGYRVDVPDGVEDRGAHRREERAPAGDDDASWIDPYAPEGSTDAIRLLGVEGLDPLAYPTRMAVLQHLEEIVSFRKSKRRRLNVQFAQEDIRKRMKKTHPDVPQRAIKAVFNALIRAQVFIHRDGTPVRTGLAPFTLVKTAEEMNAALTNLYLELLKSGGADVSDSGMLAELLLGDADRAREVEETLAWLDSPDRDEPSAIAAPVDLDLDALLSVDDVLSVDDDDALIVGEPADDEDDDDHSDDDDDTVESADDLDPDDLLLEVEEAPAEKPKKATTRRRRKKPEARA